MKSGQLLMIAGGGTGGHIYPAIAIAEEFLARDASRKVVFVGTEYGLEKKIVPKAGFPLEFISVGGLKGKSLIETVRNLLRLPASIVSSWRLISKYQPVAILGVGGYASGPILMTGALRRIPTIIHEANAYPGLTNRLLARVAGEIAVAFPEALERMKRKGTVTGNPIRRDFFDAAPPRSEAAKKRLLIFGGSQGSRIINDTVTTALPELTPLADSLEIVHQTGTSEHERIARAYRGTAFAEARVVPYLDAMWHEVAAADLVVCRAGAMTIGELCASGRAAVLIPFARATNNHQEANARVLERAGAAVVITEAELTPSRLASAVDEILGRGEATREMGERARALAVTDASGKIVDIIEKIQRN